MITKSDLKKRIKEGYRYLENFLKNLYPYYSYEYVELKDLKGLAAENINPKLAETNHWLKKESELKKSLEKQMYFPMIRNQSDGSGLGGKHRLKSIRELIQEKRLDGNKKILTITLSSDDRLKENKKIPIPPPINSRYKILGEKHTEGYYEENKEEYDPETKTSYVNCKTGEYYLTAIRLIIQRTSYYIHYLKEKYQEEYPAPKYMQYQKPDGKVKNLLFF